MVVIFNKTVSVSVHIRNILTEMGHPQPPTPIQTDNTTAEGVVNNLLHHKVDALPIGVLRVGGT